MKKLVIFDLDGTLLNTISDLGEACNHALKEMGFSQHPIPAYNYMVGNGVRKLMERAQPDADPETIDLLLKYFKEYYNTHCTVNTRPYNGIPSLLEELGRREVAVAVASNKYQEATSKIVKHYFPEIPFVAIKGQVPERPTKPDPSIIFSILSEHPVKKSEVLYVGDSGVDMETARRACVESIGVTWGFRPVMELRDNYADVIVSEPSEIIDHLNDIF